MWPLRATASSAEELQQVTIDQEEDFAYDGYVYVWISPNDLVIIALAESQRRITEVRRSAMESIQHGNPNIRPPNE